MKKLIFLLVLLIATSPVITNAQIVESSSFSQTIIQPIKEKKESKWLWCAKAGIGGLFTEGNSYFDYNAQFEGQYPLNNTGIYIGGEIGIMPVAETYNDYGSCFGGFVGPKIGINKYLINGYGWDFSLDVTFNMGFGGSNCQFITPGISAGYWFNKIYLGAKFGYAVIIDSYDNGDNSHLLFNIGYRF